MKLLQRAKTIRLNKREARLVRVMQVLGDDTRFKIFKILVSGKERCVSEIADSVGISTPAASQHFRIFELAGLVDKRRYGQKICYSIKPDNRTIKELISLT